MLNFMRKHAGSWIIKLLLGAVIVVFIFFYGWGFREKRANTIASVNSSIIAFNEYRKHYEDLLKFYQNEGVSPELIKVLNLEQRALDSLINKVLLLQEAKRLKLKVSKAEVSNHIARQPHFQKDGKFDKNTYLRFLRFYRIRPEEFEAEQKQILIIEKVENLIKDSVKLSEQEIYDIYATKNEKVALKFIRFKLSLFKEKIDPSEKEIEDYFSHHANEFKVPPKVKVNYLCFKGEDFLKTVKIDPQEVKDYYELNIQKFWQPEEIKVKHILIKTTAQDSPETLATKKRKAEKVLKEVEEGKDFSLLARKYSEGPTAKQGGDLGYIQRGQTIKPFEEVAFSLKEGEVSSLVKTEFGFHIIKVKDIKRARTEPLEKIREEVVSQLKKERAQEMAADMAEEVAGLIYRNNDLKKVAREKELSLKETGYFALNDDLPKIGKDKQFTSTAFSLKEGEVSPLIESQGKYYLMKLVEKLSSRIPELQEVEKKVKSALINKKAREEAQKKAEEFLLNLKNGRENISSLASQAKIKIEETGLFVREGDYIPRIGASKEIKDAAFSLTSQKPLYEKVLPLKDEYLVIYLKERKEAERKDYESKKDAFSERLLQQKQEGIFNKWLDNLKKKADIKINQDLVLDMK